MAREPLSDAWSLDPGGDFASRFVEDSKQYVSRLRPARTIWLDILEGDPEQSLDELIEHLAATDRPADAELFREGEGPERRFASWYREPEDDGRPTWGLTGYVVRASDQLVLACYAEEGDDGAREWALGVWRSVRFEGA